ncbi:MAG: uroporphyrinogen-III synthase [Planctomycetota bacterium]
MTRDEAADGPLSAALRSAGLAPVLEPVVARRAVGDVRDEIARLGPDDWLVLTSVFAVQSVAVEPARTPRVAVVGEASRQAALALDLRVELVSADGTAEGLFAQLADCGEGTMVLYPRSSLANAPELPAGIHVVSPVLYETAPRSWRRSVVEEVDVVAVASPSAVRAVGTVDLPYASIGPTTTAALRETGIEPWVEAAEPSFEALARAIADQCGSSRSQRA